jgi:hypothetical protein
MHWIAASERDAADGILERRVRCDSGEQFLANAGLKAHKYSAPAFRETTHAHEVRVGQPPMNANERESKEQR